MAVSIKGKTNGTIYGKGDICLKLNPFDNFRLFTLYEDWRSDDPKPLDISNGQKIYLVFKSKNKEIRIPEYDLIDSDYTVDKVNGQVLFKIPKKNAVDILAMDTRVFYIIRTYDITDSKGNTISTSEEEVLYTGLWKDESSNTVDNYTSHVKNLAGIVGDRNKQVKNLQSSNVDLMEQNTKLIAENNDLNDEVKRLNTLVDELESKLTKYESGNQYEGVVIDDNATHHVLISGMRADGNKMTEEQLSNVLKNLEIKTSE